jgi:hypothetical protein
MTNMTKRQQALVRLVRQNEKRGLATRVYGPFLAPATRHLLAGIGCEVRPFDPSAHGRLVAIKPATVNLHGPRVYLNEARVPRDWRDHELNRAV